MDLGRSLGRGTHKTYRTGFDGLAGTLPAESAEVGSVGFNPAAGPASPKTSQLGKFPSR